MEYLFELISKYFITLLNLSAEFPRLKLSSRLKGYNSSRVFKPRKNKG